MKLRKKENMSTNKIRYERGNITTDTTEIQRIIRDYTMNNCTPTNCIAQEKKKKDKCLDTNALPKLNYEEIENLNIVITCM